MVQRLYQLPGQQTPRLAMRPPVTQDCVEPSGMAHEQVPDTDGSARKYRRANVSSLEYDHGSRTSPQHHEGGHAAAPQNSRRTYSKLGIWCRLGLFVVASTILAGSLAYASVTVFVSIGDDPVEEALTAIASTSDGASAPVLEEGAQCPDCSSFFGKLKPSRTGKGVQEVRMQVRGEPKSGTSFMFEWAVNALVVTCRRLASLYGGDVCSMYWQHTDRPSEIKKAISEKFSVIDMKVVTMTFDPGAAAQDLEKEEQPSRNNTSRRNANCHCKDVKKVVTTVSHLHKHDLPVKQTCPWQHMDGIAREGGGCSHTQGRPVRNYTDVLSCLHGTSCAVVDRRLQMLVLRDPRPVAVSSYYWLKTHPSRVAGIREGERVDEYALRMLPTLCQFILLRYTFLHERMPKETADFLYHESLADPLEWHRRWLSFAGLSLPDSVVRDAAGIASRREYAFAQKGVDEHPGGQSASPSRSYAEEVGAEASAKMDSIVRAWLPAELREKLGIAF